MSSLSVKPATIAGSASITAEIDLGLPGLRAIAMVGAWTDAPLTFLVPSVDGTGWVELYDDQGNPMKVPVTAGAYQELDRWQWRGVDKLKIRSGSLDTPVVQPVDAAIALIGNFLTDPAVLRDPSRTIVLKTPYWLDSFPALTVDEAGVCTFDLVRLLDVGEAITAIDSFSLTPVRPDAATDTDVIDRIAGTAVINGTTISQRFGNWQQDVAFIKYLVTAVYFTTSGGPKSVSGYQTVWQRPN